MMVRIAKEKALPFEPLVLNKETIAAMKETRRGTTAPQASHRFDVSVLRGRGQSGEHHGLDHTLTQW